MPKQRDVSRRAHMSLHLDMRWPLHLPDQCHMFAQLDVSGSEYMFRNADMRSGHMCIDPSDLCRR
jgi:hypothetical protein